MVIIPSRQSPYFLMSRNQLQGMNSASLCSLAGRYDNLIPTRFLAPTDCSKTQVFFPCNRFLASIKRLKIRALACRVVVFFNWSQEKRIYLYLNSRRKEEKTNLFVPKLSKKRRQTKVFVPQPSKERRKIMHSSLNCQRDDEKRIYLFQNYLKNEDKPKYLFLNHQRNEEKLIHLSLNYQRDKQKRIYLFLNYQRNEDEPKYLFLNYRRNEDEPKYLFLNYRRKEDNAKYSFLNYRWFDITTDDISGSLYYNAAEWDEDFITPCIEMALRATFFSKLCM
jgi:hypothetical protein